MTWNIRCVTQTLAVTRLAEGIEFYSRLGFELDWSWPQGEPHHAGMHLGPCSIQLAECDPAVQATLYFTVDDVDACYRAISAARPWELAAQATARPHPGQERPKRSLEAPKPPQNSPYGMRDFSLIDPWGHQLDFGSELA